MVIYNMFCKIDEPICVSEKLGLYLVNPTKKDPFYSSVKEILNKNLAQEKKHSKKWEDQQYDLKKIMMSSYWNNLFEIDKNSTEKDCINEIVKNIVILTQLDVSGTIYDEFDEKRLHWNQIDEYSLEHKIGMLENWLPSLSGKKFPGIIYDDETDGIFSQNTYYHILSALQVRIKKNEFFSKKSYHENKEDLKNSLEEIYWFKVALDDYVETKEDFYKLDFIMEYLVEQTSHYQRFLSPFYIIEMLLVNPKKKIREQCKEKIKYFYWENNKDIKNNIEKFSTIIYDIRSKLVHGDFKNFENELQKYKKNFMNNFYFDYYEFTENHWILGNAGIILEGIAKNLVMALLQSKEELIKFKNDDKTSFYFK